MKKIIICLLAFLFVGCSNEVNDIDKFKTEYESLNEMSAVKIDINTNRSIIYKNSEEIVNIMENGSGIIYFGFPYCPWCRNIIPVLLNVANKNNVDVYYLNTQELRGSDDPNYTKIMELVDEYLYANEDGEKILYVPDVYFVKDGKIIGHHLGSVESQTDPSVALNDDQISELKNIYQDYIKQIKTGFTEKIVNHVVDLFSDLNNIKYGKEITVFVISMIPILELRGGILASALLDMNWLTSFIVCLIGNIIVIPIALYLLTGIFNLLKKIKGIGKLVTKFENKTLSKRGKLDKYGYLGLLLFVGIPLPGTGVWTGCLLASLLEMNKKKSFLAAMGGVLMAGVIMLILSFGIIKNII